MSLCCECKLNALFGFNWILRRLQSSMKEPKVGAVAFCVLSDMDDLFSSFADIECLCLRSTCASIIPLRSAWTLTVWLVVLKTHVIDNHLCLLLLYLHATAEFVPYWGIDYNPSRLSRLALWIKPSLISKTYQMNINYTLWWRLFDGKIFVRNNICVGNDFWLKLICLRCLLVRKMIYEKSLTGGYHDETLLYKRSLFFMHQTSNKSTDPWRDAQIEHFLRSLTELLFLHTAQQCVISCYKRQKSESFVHACFNALRIALWPHSIRKW